MLDRDVNVIKKITAKSFSRCAQGSIRLYSSLKIFDFSTDKTRSLSAIPAWTQFSSMVTFAENVKWTTSAQRHPEGYFNFNGLLWRVFYIELLHFCLHTTEPKFFRLISRLFLKRSNVYMTGYLMLSIWYCALSSFIGEVVKRGLLKKV